MKSQNYALVVFIFLLLTTLVVRIYRDGQEEMALERQYEAQGDRRHADQTLLYDGNSFYANGVMEDGCIGLHYTAAVNEVSIYYEKAGRGKPVILLHENNGSHKSLETMIRQLVNAGYEVYAPDSRGQGANPPVAEYHYADMAEDVYNLIQEWKLDSPVVYGWSDGGIIGLLLCLNHPGVVKALAVSGANLYPEGLDNSFLAPIRISNTLVRTPLSTMILEEPMIDPAELAEIRIPVLVTAGENDIVRRDHTELIADSLPDSRLNILPGETHGSYIVDSQIMGNLLIEFLNEI